MRKCWYCTHGRQNLCTSARVYGVHCADYKLDGAMAEYIAVPERILYHIPVDLSYSNAALVEPFAIGLVVIKSLKYTGCSMVFMGSLHAYGGEADRPAYASSKGACHTLYKHMARNYVNQGIRSNWVTIGWVATPGEIEFRKKQGIEDSWLEKTGAQIMPMGRLQRDTDYVDGVLYLLSDGASQTSGSEIFITGGFTL